MGNGFGVDPEVIRDHVRSLQGPFSMIKGAATAADQVGLGGFDHYGLFLQAVVPPVLEVCLSDAGEAIESTAELGEAIGRALDGVAATYEEADAQIAADLEKITKEMD